MTVLLVPSEIPDIRTPELMCITGTSSGGPDRCGQLGARTRAAFATQVIPPTGVVAGTCPLLCVAKCPRCSPPCPPTLRKSLHHAVPALDAVLNVVRVSVDIPVGHLADAVHGEVAGQGVLE